MVDGISGVDLATVMFDLTPVPPEVPHSDEPWQPAARADGRRARRRRGARAGAGRRGRRRRRAGRRAQPAGDAARARARRPRASARSPGPALNPAPATPLNVEIGPHRRSASCATGSTDFKQVKNAFGGTVNDVVLTVVSGALRDWLHSRGVRTEGLELRALVPVSIRARRTSRAQLGNRIDA